MKHFTILGQVPPKKNNRIINRKTGRSFPSERYVAWHESAVMQIAQQRLGFSVKEGKQCKIAIKFYHQNRIPRDLDNCVNSIFDTLKDTFVVPDDNWMIIRKLYADNDQDKDNPRAEIYIYDIAEDVSIHF